MHNERTVSKQPRGHLESPHNDGNKVIHRRHPTLQHFRCVGARTSKLLDIKPKHLHAERENYATLYLFSSFLRDQASFMQILQCKWLYDTMCVCVCVCVCVFLFFHLNWSRLNSCYARVENFLSQNCDISSVLSIFKYNNPGKNNTNDKFITSQ